MRSHQSSPSSLDVLIQAVVSLLADHLAKTEKEPARLAEEIQWNPALFREQTLAEWMRCDDQTLRECQRVLEAVAGSIGETPDPVGLPDDVATPIYGSRPAEGYAATASSFVQEVSEEPLDPFTQKRRVVYMALQNLLDDAARRTPEEARTLVKTLESYLAVARQVLEVS